MAEYQLTKQEYERLFLKGDIVRSLWVKVLTRILLILVALACFALILYIRQWLAAALVVSFIVFVALMGRRYTRVGFGQDCFQAGRVQVEILPDMIRIRSGMNEVQFAYAALDGVLEYPRCFVIHHYSGFQVRVPRERLTESEVSQLVGLQSVLPTVARRMYKQ